jgi:uncharacterized membrane protein YqaE (UPF0057 family)
MIKRIFTLLFCFVVLFSTTEASVSSTTTIENALNPSVLSIAGTDGNPITFKELVKLSPKQVQKLTGKRMSLQQKIAWKLMQKKFKKGGDAEISKGLYIVLAIFGLGWLAMGLNDEWEGSDWLISLLLYFLFYLPGLIFTLVKMKKYYN